MFGKKRSDEGDWIAPENAAADPEGGGEVWAEDDGYYAEGEYTEGEYAEGEYPAEYAEGEYAEDGYYDEEVAQQPAGRDPMVPWLVLTVLMLLVVLIAAAGSVVFYLLGLRGAPRTANERAIYTAETSVKESPGKESYLALIYAYVNAERYGDAMATVKRARGGKQVSEYDMAEADTLRAMGRYKEALAEYQRAIKTNDKEWDKYIDDMMAKGVDPPSDRPLKVALLIGEAETYVKLNQKKDALAAFQGAIKLDPTNSFALTRMGDLQAELGKKDDAKKSYEEALRYIPDYKEALDGLERLTAGKE